jgi:hypothetical protein
MGPPQAGQGRRDVISQFFGTMRQAYCRRGSGDKVGGKFVTQRWQRLAAHFGRLRDFLLRALAEAGAATQIAIVQCPETKWCCGLASRSALFGHGELDADNMLIILTISD